MPTVTKEQFVCNFQSDHLILIVGGNALPAYVAARLLAKPAAKIWLLYSASIEGEGEDEPSTRESARRLEEMLIKCEASWECSLIPISSSDNRLIEDQVKKYLLPGLSGASRVGLNYTGGTKPMAIHVYRLLEQGVKKQLICSYLDPRKLMLRFDHQKSDQVSGFPILEIDFLRERVCLSLEELTHLHRYRPPAADTTVRISVVEWRTRKENAAVGELEEAIAAMYKDESHQTVWENWLQGFSSQDKNVDIALPDEQKQPALAPVLRAMEGLCGGASNLTGKALADAISVNSPKKLKSCSKWFAGGWLEGYATSAFQRAAQKFGIPENAMGQNLLYALEGGRVADYFELDAAAIYGYQLFAVSCTNSENDDALIKGSRAGNIGHLLEVYVRARQLGGDEARIALVCRSDDPDSLESQFHHSWDPDGKIRVFGLRHLARLEDHFLEWFRTANHQTGGLV